MKLYSLFLGNMLRWNLTVDDPTTWPGIAELDAVVLNPFVTLEDEQFPTSFPLGDGRYHVLTNRIYLVTPTAIGYEKLEQAVKPWLRLLRITSRQASLPTDIYGYSEREFDLGTVKLAPSALKRGTLFGEFHILTGLDAAAILHAHKLGTETASPLFHELILDALQALEIRRYREAILYSAIAVEALAQHELTRIYEEALATDPPPDHLNILNIALPGGKTGRKDPVFALLTESDNFGRLLHEAPLYLMRRSLLDELPELFRRAKSLYGTRNRLGHGQSVEPEHEHLLQLDADGAKSAVQTAVEVFDWFGIAGYHVPDHKAVEIIG